jgi:DNA mismatch repair protein MutL
MEVRFLNESEVYRTTFHAVQEALARGMRTVSWDETPVGKTFDPPPVPRPQTGYAAPQPSATPLFLREPAATVEWIAPTVANANGQGEEEELLTVPRDPLTESPQSEVPPAPSIPVRRETILEFNYLIYDRTYIITLEPDGILLTDQHAAHERILYERIKQRAENGGTRGQLLLQPLVVELSPEEEGVLDRAATPLTEAGFEIEGFGASAILLRGLPFEATAEKAASILHQILEELLTGVTGGGLTMRDRVFASLACHNAIKAEDNITKLEVQTLLKDLANCQNPKTCPHGRPTQVKVKKEEILRMFRRI